MEQYFIIEFSKCFFHFSYKLTFKNVQMSLNRQKGRIEQKLFYLHFKRNQKISIRQIRICATDDSNMLVNKIF